MNDFQTYLDQALSNIELSSDNQPNENLDYNILNVVCQLITTTRNNAGITQQQLAMKSGISQANISKIENGNYNPSVTILKRIADGLGKRLVIGFTSKEDNQ